MHTIPSLAFGALTAALALPTLAADYVQAPGSSLAFAGTYQGERFAGAFPDFRTTVSFDPANPAAGRLAVTIALATATTQNTDYDTEMRGSAFLDAAQFVQATYTATGFRDLGNGQYAADGTLALRGVRRPVTLTFNWTPGVRPLLSGSATVHRLDFGVGGGAWADTALLPDEIEVSTRVHLRSAE